MAYTPPIIVKTGGDHYLSWVPREDKVEHSGETHIPSESEIGDGYLFGTPELKKKVFALLDNPDITEARVGWATWTFTPSRSTKHDVVAAMLDVTHGRAVFQGAFEAMAEVMPELTDPENNEPGVIY